MALTKKDLQEIGKVVDEKINTAIDAKVPVMISKEIGLLRLEMNQRFDLADAKNTKEHQEIISKIEEVKQMETEDIEVLYADVAKVKRKVGIA